MKKYKIEKNIDLEVIYWGFKLVKGFELFNEHGFF